MQIFYKSLINTSRYKTHTLDVEEGTTVKEFIAKAAKNERQDPRILAITFGGRYLKNELVLTKEYKEHTFHLTIQWAMYNKIHNIYRLLIMFNNKIYYLHNWHKNKSVKSLKEYLIQKPYHSGCVYEGPNSIVKFKEDLKKMFPYVKLYDIVLQIEVSHTSIKNDAKPTKFQLEIEDNKPIEYYGIKEDSIIYIEIQNHDSEAVTAV